MAISMRKMLLHRFEKVGNNGAVARGGGSEGFLRESVKKVAPNFVLDSGAKVALLPNFLMKIRRLPVQREIFC